VSVYVCDGILTYADAWTWTLSKKDKDKLQAFQVKCFFHTNAEHTMATED